VIVKRRIANVVILIAAANVGDAVKVTLAANSVILPLTVSVGVAMRLREA
jgi:hypothetical protein